jgi:hypothetical protein
MSAVIEALEGVWGVVIYRSLMVGLMAADSDQDDDGDFPSVVAYLLS